MQIGLIALDDHEHQTMEHEDESSLRFSRICKQVRSERARLYIYFYREEHKKMKKFFSAFCFGALFLDCLTLIKRKFC